MKSSTSNIVSFPKKKRKRVSTSETLLKPDDFRKWFFKYRLRSGLEGCYPVSASEKRWVRDALPGICESEHISFLEFDSKKHRILIQSSQLVFFQFLFENYDAGKEEPKQNNEEDDDENKVVIYFSDSTTPLIFKVDDDVPDPKDEGNRGEMNNFIHSAQYIHEGHEMLNFTSEDGEVTFFRGSAISLAEIPLGVLNIQELEDVDKK